MVFLLHKEIIGILEGYRKGSDVTPPGGVHLKFRKHFFTLDCKNVTATLKNFRKK